MVNTKLQIYNEKKKCGSCANNKGIVVLIK